MKIYKLSIIYIILCRFVALAFTDDYDDDEDIVYDNYQNKTQSINKSKAKV